MTARHESFEVAADPTASENSGDDDFFSSCNNNNNSNHGVAVAPSCPEGENMEITEGAGGMYRERHSISEVPTKVTATVSATTALDTSVERIARRRPSRASLLTHFQDAWDETWDQDTDDEEDEEKGEDDLEDVRLSGMEEKQEMRFADGVIDSQDESILTTTAAATSPIEEEVTSAELASTARTCPFPAARPVHRRASTPSTLSSGRPSPSPCKRRERPAVGGGGTASFSAAFQDHHEVHFIPQLTSPMSPETASSGNSTHSVPAARTHNRKNSAPRLGMLQSAQDLASATKGAGKGGGGGEELPPIDEGASDGDHGPVRGKHAPTISSVDDTETKANESKTGAEVESKGTERPLLPPVSVTGPTMPYWEAVQREASIGRSGGVGGGWVSVGGVAEEARKLRAKANSFIGRLPGPKKIMQALEGELDVKKLRLTTRSEPIILMEVMPAAMVVSLLLLTYLFFAAGVGLIVRHNLVGTSTLSAKEDEAPGGGCRSNFTHNPDPAIPSAFGCTEFYPDIFSTPLLAPPSEEEEEDLAAGTKYGAVFSGDFAGMKKLYGSVSLHASFANATTLESLPDPAVVDLTLEACTEGPEEGGESGVCEEGWAPVLSQTDISVRIRNLPMDRGYTIFNFFQNQETMRGQPLIKQYRLQVGFVRPNASSSTHELNGLDEATWSLEYEKGVTEQWARITLASVLVLWLPAWLSWCYVVFYHKSGGAGFKNALHERKWLAFLGLSMALYLNPIMVVGNFVAPGSASWGLASEMLMSVAAASFLVVALCIADGIVRDRVGDSDRRRGHMEFYIPKIMLGAVTLGLMLVMDLMSFPSFTAWKRDSLLAVQNWPESERRTFIIVASARIAMVVFWGVWMLWRIYISGSLLRQLPYVPTRYQQLSYRFFALQAFLLGVVYVMFALWRLIDILAKDLGGNTVAAEFMLFIKTRQDHLGSVSLLSTYTLQLLLLYLPASLKESVLFRDIAVRFVYFEAQLPLAKNQGKAQGNQGEAQGEGGSVGDDNSPRDILTAIDTQDKSAKDEERPLFCVETAARLLEIAGETYNDPEGFQNPNKYHFGVADFKRVGFELVAHIFNAEHDTHCFVLQDRPKARLVIAFRGSAGTKHWRDNLRFLQTEFNMDHMMPRGRESEAPKVLAEDIDTHAAETLRDVVAHVATARGSEERMPGAKAEGTKLALGEGGSNRSTRAGSSSTDLCTPAITAGGSESGGGGQGGIDRTSSGNAHLESAENLDTPEAPPLGSLTTTVRSYGSSVAGFQSEQSRSEPISPSGIRSILKGFSLLPWQFRDTWDRKIATFNSNSSHSHPNLKHHQRKVVHDDDRCAGGDESKTAMEHDIEAGEREGNVSATGGGVVNFDIHGDTSGDIGGDVSGRREGNSAAFDLARRVSRSERLSSSKLAGLGSPRLGRSNSMSLMERRKRCWIVADASGKHLASGSSIGSNTTRQTPGSRGQLFGRWASGPGRARQRSASFDEAAALAAVRNESEGASGHRSAPWRTGVGWGGLSPAESGGLRDQASPGMMEGLGRGLVRRGEDLVRGTEAGLDRAAKAAKRGLEAADNAAHVMGINRIPVLRQYLWGQVHTGFWNSYEAVRGEIHATVRKTVVDWLLTDDHPPDIKIYVTGHSMGGALATHCAMDLQLHTIDKIKARLGNFVRVRQTLLRRVMGSLPRRLPHLRHLHHHQREEDHEDTSGRDELSASAGTMTMAGGGGRGASHALKRVTNLGKRRQRLGSPPCSMASPLHEGTNEGHADASVAVDGKPVGRGNSNGNAIDGGAGGRMMPDLPRCERENGAVNNAGGRAFGGSGKNAMRRVAPSVSPFAAFSSTAAVASGDDSDAGGGAKVLRKVASSINTVASALDPRNLVHSSPALRSRLSGGGGNGEVHRAEDHSDLGGHEGEADGEDRPKGTVELQMLSFGAPRVGNSIYAARYNDVVPHSFRVVVDGDPVPGVPSWWYRHVGTKVLIDGRGGGSLIMDPSFVEKRFFVRSKRYVLSHLVEAYQAGLRGNLLQAMPPEVANILPRHWPFGVPEDTGNGSSEASSGAEYSAHEGSLPSPLTVKQADFAQNAVDALHEAEQLNRAQSFRIVTGGGIYRGTSVGRGAGGGTKKQVASAGVEKKAGRGMDSTDLPEELDAV